MSEVTRRLGYEPSGGSHRYMKSHFVRLGLDTAHFTGQSWAKGRTFPDRRRIPLEAALAQNSTYPTGRLRKRLVAAGLLPLRCQLWSSSSVSGWPCQSAMPHINGEHTDNRLANLRILCPNCHSLAETFANKRTRRTVPVEGLEPSLSST